jgi:hypothetical protein
MKDCVRKLSGAPIALALDERLIRLTFVNGSPHINPKMAKTFELDFHGTKFTVPKISLFNLIDRHAELSAATTYDVQSSVPLDLFEVFVKALKKGSKIPVTSETAGPLSLLAEEFRFVELLSECSSLQVNASAGSISILSDRVSKLEHHMSLLPLAIIAELKESITSHDRQLESLLSPLDSYPDILQAEINEVRASVDGLQTELRRLSTISESLRTDIGDARSSVDGLQAGLRWLNSFSISLRTDIDTVNGSAEFLEAEIPRIKSKCDIEVGSLRSLVVTIDRKFSDSLSQMTPRLAACERRLDTLTSPAAVSTPNPTQRPAYAPSPASRASSAVYGRRQQVNCPFAPLKSDGILSYLTRKHGGNVHDRRIVTITSKSVDRNGARNYTFLADLTTNMFFCSKDEPSQWVCWDFHGMCVRLTGYTIHTPDSNQLKSWVVRGSVDGTSWMDIDRRINSVDLSRGETASFAVSKCGELCHIAVVQENWNHWQKNVLCIKAVEFFGVLTE